MNHGQYKEWISLSIFDELSEKERETLDMHLQSCDECRIEFEALRRFQSVIEQHQALEPSEELLREARQELRAALRLDRSRRTILQRLGEQFDLFLQSRLRVAFGGGVVFVLGLLIGFIILPPRNVMQFGRPYRTANEATAMDEDVRIMNVQFINHDQDGKNTLHGSVENGEIEFTFDAVKPARMKGRIDDEHVQKILAHALVSEHNPGVRIQSVNAISSSKTSFVDADVKAALINAAQFDDNPGVRMEAIKVLRRYPLDAEIKHAFLNVLLTDQTSGLRIEAINALVGEKGDRRFLDQDVLNAFRDKVTSDDNSYIRLRARTVLQEN